MNPFYRFLFLTVFALTAAGCVKTDASLRPAKKPLEYYQTYNFSSNIQSIQKALHVILRERGYEIQEEDALQMTALNTDLTSVEILTYSVERLNPTQSVFSGEVLLTIDFLESPDGGTFVSIHPKIQAVIGRTTLLKNQEWKGDIVTLTSRGDLENEILKALARRLKERQALKILVTREVELEGGFAL